MQHNYLGFLTNNSGRKIGAPVERSPFVRDWKNYPVTFVNRSGRWATTSDCRLSVGAAPITGRMRGGKVHATYRVVKGKQHAGVGNDNYPISIRLLTPFACIHVDTN